MERKIKKSGIPFFIFYCLNELLIGGGSDPCSPSEYSTAIPNILQRSPSSYLRPSDTAICDRYLSKGWYRIDGYKLPDSPPSPFTCMTFYPIWRRGDIPKGENETQTVEMCIVEFSNTCSKPFNITVKKCTDFLVYELVPISFCSAAYCFDWNTECVNETVANVAVEFFDYSWRKISNSDPAISHLDASLQLICNFSFLDDAQLFYKIYWQLDEMQVNMNQVVNRTTADTALLTAYDMLRYGKKIGITIRCSVAAMYVKEGDACQATESQPFFAGFRVHNPIIRLHESESADIVIEPTIPFADMFTIRNNYPNKAHPVSIELIPPSTIQDLCADGAVTYSKCRTEIKPFPFSKRQTYKTDQSWRNPVTFTLFARQPTKTDIPDVEVTLLMKTVLVGGNHIRNGSLIFHEVDLPKVIVQKTSSKSDVLLTECSSLTDPHIRTFDNVKYECQEATGSFILYRNNASNQEVQIKQRKCSSWYTYPYCNCAVAVRAGKDVFVVDICNGGSFDFVDYTFCEDKILDVVKLEDTKYEIRMPSGTTVFVALRKWPDQYTLQLDVVIKPALRDYKKTEGLCGIFDGNKHNEFTRSTGEVDSVNTADDYYANRPKLFSKSWQFGEDTRMLQGKNLFSQDESLFKNLKRISDSNFLLCTCEDKPGVPEYGQTNCSYDQAVRCSGQSRKKILCDVFRGSTTYNLHRRKREAHIRDYQLNPNERILKHRPKRQTYTVMSESEAEMVCENTFGSSELLSLCQERANRMSNTSYINCVMDVMATADENVTLLHVQASTEECSRITTQNSTIEHQDPELFLTVANSCPLNCSNHGSCSNGTCICEEGFAGDDCSFDKSPPDISITNDVVLCDKAESDCEESSIYGRYFLDNTESYCSFKRIVEYVNNSVKHSSSYTKPLKARTIFEGRCPLEYSGVSTNDVWTYTFEYNITNDGKRFSETKTTIVFDSVCQEFHNNSGNFYFSLKLGYCFIRNTCYSANKENASNICLLCDPDKSLYNWTYNEECNEDEVAPKHLEDDTGLIKWILIAIICGLGVVFTVAFVAVKFFTKYSSRSSIQGIQYVDKKDISFNPKFKRQEQCWSRPTSPEQYRDTPEDNTTACQSSVSLHGLLT